MSSRLPETAALKLGSFLGNSGDAAATTARHLCDPGDLIAGFDGARRIYDVAEFLNLPPAAFVARSYAALLGRAPDAAHFVGIRDLLLTSAMRRTDLLAALLKQARDEGRIVHLSGMPRARAAQRLTASAPVQLALALARLARNLRRLPKNLRHARQSRDVEAVSEPLLAAPAVIGRKPRIAIVAVTSGKGEMGGAERFHAGLHAALNAAGLGAELVPLESREESFPAVQQSYRNFQYLDLSAYDGVISSKAPSYAVRHPNHVCYLMHTMRGYYDMFGASHPYASLRSHREAIWVQATDTVLLQKPRRLLAIGAEVALRLRGYNGLEARVVHVPTSMTGLTRNAPTRNALAPGPSHHLLMAGRLHPWKRVDLAIAAMRHVEAPARLVIAGAGQEEMPLRTLAKGDPRVAFVGAVSDARLAELYAEAAAVLFLPRGEDLGLVTLEAFAAGKPVITCDDSGEPARLVRDGANGFVCPPKPRAIAAAIDRILRDPAQAEAMGAAGAHSIASITWAHVAAELGAALGFPVG